MTQTMEATEKLDVRLPKSMRAELVRIALERGEATGKTVMIADILREAVSHYLADRNIFISPEVNRGGNRRVPTIIDSEIEPELAELAEVEMAG